MFTVKRKMRNHLYFIKPNIELAINPRLSLVSIYLCSLKELEHFQYVKMFNFFNQILDNELASVSNTMQVLKWRNQ